MENVNSGFSPMERKFLDSIEDPDIRSAHEGMSPEDLRDIMLLEGYAEEQQLNPNMPPESVMASVEQQAQEQDTRDILAKEEPKGTWVDRLPETMVKAVESRNRSDVAIAKDIAKQVVRGPMSALIRGGDTAKRLIVGPAIVNLTGLAEEISGMDIMSVETEKQLLSRISDADLEYFTSVFDTVKTSSPFGAAIDALGNFGAGYAAVSLAAPLLIPASLVTKAAAGYTAAAAKLGVTSGRVLKWTSTVLREAFKGDLADTIFGDPRLFSQKLIKAAVGTDLKNKPESVKLTAKFLENTVLSLGFGAALKGAGKLLEVLKRKLGKDATQDAMMRTLDILDDSAELTKASQASADDVMSKYWKESYDKKQQMYTELFNSPEFVGKEEAKARALDEVLSEVAEINQKKAAAFTEDLLKSPAVTAEVDERLFLEKVQPEILKTLDDSLDGLLLSKPAVAGATPDIVLPKVKAKAVTKTPPPEPEVIIKKAKKAKVSDVAPLKTNTTKFRESYVSKYPEKQELRKAALVQEEAAAVGLGGGPVVVGGDNLDGDIIQGLYDTLKATKATDWVSGVDAVAEDLGVPKDIVKAVADRLESFAFERGPKGAIKGDIIVDLWTGETLGSAKDIYKNIARAKRDKVAPQVVKRISNGPMYGSILGITPGSLKKMEPFVSALYGATKSYGVGPVTTTAGVMFLDMLDGEQDFSWDAYMTMATMGLAFNVVGRHVYSKGTLMNQALKKTYEAQLAAGTIELTALGKSVMSKEDQAKFLGSVADDYLRGTIDRGQRWVTKALSELTPADGKLTNLGIVPDADITKVFNDAGTGVARGIPDLVRTEAFYSPQYLLDAAVELTSDFMKRMPKFTGSFSELTTRWDNFTKDLQLTETAVQFFESLGGGTMTPEKRTAIMMALDSLESKVLSDFGKVLHKTKGGTLGEQAQVAQAHGALMLFRELCSDPRLLLESRHGDQTVMATVFKQLDEEMSKKLRGSIAMDRYFNAANHVASNLKSLIDAKGNIPQALRKDVYTFLDETAKDPTLADRTVYGVFCTTLSGLSMVKGALMSNTFQAMKEIGSKAIAGVGHRIAGDTAGVEANRAWFEALVKGEGFWDSVKLLSNTLETGVKAFDSMGERPIYKSMVKLNAARKFGGSRESASVIEKSLDFIGEVFGADPITMSKAADVFHQSMMFNAYLKEGLILEAQNISLTNNIPITDALKSVIDDVAKKGNIADLAMKKSRGLFGIEPPVVPLIKGAEGKVEQGLAVSGEMADALGQLSSIGPVKLVQQFFATETNYTLASWEYNPIVQSLSALWDAMPGGFGRRQGLVFNSKFHSGNMTKANRETLDRAVRDKGAKIIAGTMFAGGLATLLYSAGASYVSPLIGRHKKLKNLGATTDGGIITADGQFQGLGQGTNVKMLLNLVDIVEYFGSLDDPDDIAMDEANTVGYLLAYGLATMAPESVHNLAANFAFLGTSSNNDTQSSLVEGLRRFSDDLFGRFSPTLLRQLEAWTEGVVKRRATLMAPAEPIVDIYNDTHGSMVGTLGGTTRPTYTDDTSKYLAEAGVDVSREYRLSYAGKPVKDRRLQQKFNKILGGLLKDPTIKESFSGLKTYDDPELRKEKAKELFSMVRGLAIGDSELFQELEEYTK